MELRPRQGLPDGIIGARFHPGPDVTDTPVTQVTPVNL
jgi:hypothetical protein